MKITAFNGSPRGEQGNTHIMVEAFLAGAKNAGAEVENLLLKHKNIKHCLGCFSCWTKTPGKCVIPDDMAELLEKYLASDIVIIATPLYVDFVSGLMKDFLDRSIPLVAPQFEKAETGQTRHVERYQKYPRLVMMSNCGFPEQEQFEVLRLFCERRIKQNQAEILAQIYRSQGELLKVDHIMLKPVQANYRKLLGKAGEEIVKNLKLSEQTRKALEKPLIPENLYSEMANKYWNEELNRVKAN